jgi:hypothetical protein
MAFVNTNYETNDGTIMRIRMDEDTLSAAGAAASGPAQLGAFVKISKTDREFGVRPRCIVLKRTVGTGDDSFSKYRRVPVLTQADYDGRVENSTVTVGGQTWTIGSKLPEDY